MDLGSIALFTSRYRAKEITEEDISLFSEITDQIHQKMEMTLYFVLFALSDTYCDNKIEFDRLINMLNSKTSSETKEKFESFDIFQNKIQELKQENNNAYETINNLQTENNNAVEEINKLKSEINRLKKQLNAK